MIISLRFAELYSLQITKNDIKSDLCDGLMNRRFFNVLTALTDKTVTLNIID